MPVSNPNRHSLTKAERLAYVNAVKCLTTKPSRTPATDIPGARTRYDDFVASHLVETPYVHASGKFLAFHRYYVHIYERALREECGYKGAHPYWDWSLTYKDLAQSPLFDGSDTSMGGDGKYVPDREPTVLNVAPGISFIIPPANGGGCVQKGPFAEGKFEVNLGPVGMPPAGPDNGLGYNPRCLTRDLNKEFSNIARPTNVTKLFEGTPDVGTFLSVMDPPTFPGVHGAGHFSLGGIELDLWASPSDPVFFLHHANIDRMWTIWQGQDLANRTNMMWGTGTTGNSEFFFSSLFVFKRLLTSCSPSQRRCHAEYDRHLRPRFWPQGHEGPCV